MNFWGLSVNTSVSFCNFFLQLFTFLENHCVGQFSIFLKKILTAYWSLTFEVVFKHILWLWKGKFKWRLHILIPYNSIFCVFVLFVVDFQDRLNGCVFKIGLFGLSWCGMVSLLLQGHTVCSSHHNFPDTGLPFWVSFCCPLIFSKHSVSTSGSVN